MEQHSFEDVWQLKEKIKDAAKSTASDKKATIITLYFSVLKVIVAVLYIIVRLINC